MVKIKKSLCAFVAAAAVLLGCGSMSAYAGTDGEGSYTMPEPMYDQAAVKKWMDSLPEDVAGDAINEWMFNMADAGYSEEQIDQILYGEDYLAYLPMPLAPSGAINIYADIVIPKTEGVTYYFVDPTDTGAVAPGDSFEDILGYISDISYGQWMSSAGIEFYEDADKANYIIKLRGYKRNLFTIYYTFAPESNIESLYFENGTVNAESGHDGNVTLSTGKGDYSFFTIGLSGSNGSADDSGSTSTQGTFNVTPLFQKPYTVQTSDTIPDGVTVNGLSATVSKGESVTFQVNHSADCTVTVKAGDTVLNPASSAETSDTYTIYNITADTTITVESTKKTYTISAADTIPAGCGISVNGVALGTDGVKIDYGTPATVKVTADPGYTVTALYNGTAEIPLTDGAYTIPVTNTADWYLTAMVKSTPDISIESAGPEVFENTDGGEPYKGYFYTVAKKNGDANTPFTFVVKADYMVNQVPYSTSYRSPVLTLAVGNPVYFGVAAPKDYNIFAYADLDGTGEAIGAGITKTEYPAQAAAEETVPTE